MCNDKVHDEPKFVKFLTNYLDIAILLLIFCSVCVRIDMGLCGSGRIFLISVKNNEIQRKREFDYEQ